MSETRPGGDAAAYAARALRTHAAMRTRFERRDGMLRRDGPLHLPGTVAHLWPLARALVASLDLAGMSPDAAGAVPDLGAVVGRRLAALERYWDDRGPAYASDPPGGRIGGDVYYDDNAWVGLALVQLRRLWPGTGPLDRASQIAEFARGGWDAEHGGIHWVQQGRGIGARNHDRNAISTAPNAQVMLHLAELGERPEAGAAAGRPTPADCAEWVAGTLTGPGGLIRDKVRGDGGIDVATWTYNQGSMVGLHVQLARAAPDAATQTERLAAARALAVRALDHYGSTGYAGEPDEFVAILARNLLLLHFALPPEDPLRERILATVRERADASWARGDPERHGTLLAHSARVSLHALAAWDPGDLGRLA